MACAGRAAPPARYRRSAGRGDALFRERMIVVGVNEKMRHARMLRVLLVQLFQNCRRLALIGIGGIGWGCRGLQGERIEHLSLVIVGVALRHLLHRHVIGGEPGIDRGLVVVAVVGAQRLDPGPLPLCPGTDRARLFERGPAGFRLGPRRRGGKRVAEIVERDAPIGDRAPGILLQDSLERLARVDEPVRMDHRDAALEVGLHLGIAGGGETQLSKLLVLLAEGAEAQRCGDAGDKYQTLPLHEYLRAHDLQ